MKHIAGMFASLCFPRCTVPDETATSLADCDCEHCRKVAKTAGLTDEQIAKNQADFTRLQRKYAGSRARA